MAAAKVDGGPYFTAPTIVGSAPGTIAAISPRAMPHCLPFPDIEAQTQPVLIAEKRIHHGMEVRQRKIGRTTEGTALA